MQRERHVDPEEKTEGGTAAAETRALQRLCRQSSITPDTEIAVRELVSAGAMVTPQDGGGDGGDECCSPLLHWVRKGEVALVKALLETENAINFLAVDEDSNTVFHAALSGPGKSDEVVHELISALVERLESHLEDIGDVDDGSGLVVWEMKNNACLDFLHFAVMTEQLAVVYPLIRERPYYGDRLTPLALKVCPSDADWDELKKAITNLPDELLHPHVALYKEVAQDSPDLSEVRLLLGIGADIYYRPPNTQQNTTLHNAVLYGHAEVLESMLEAPRQTVIDFTREGFRGRSPIHWICLNFTDGTAPHTVEVMRRMLGAVTHRLATHPDDRVDWGQLDEEGYDFLSYAAREGVLSALYPLVKDLPYYRDGAKPIEVGYRPSEEDWGRLRSAELDAELVIPTEEENASRRLFDEIVKDTPNLDTVKHYVSAGGNLLYGDQDYPTLTYCLVKGHPVEVWKALLETERDINFSVCGQNGVSVLHNIAWLPTAEARREVMAAAVERLDSHPNDRAEWGRGRGQYDVLSHAALHGALSDIFPAVKHVSYFESKPKPYVLTFQPFDDDWSQLSSEDQEALQGPVSKDDLNERLFDEVKLDSPNLTEIRRLVVLKADLLHTPSTSTYPTLHYCLLLGHLASLRVLLETCSSSIDFTVTDQWDRTPLFYIVTHITLLPATLIVDMLKAVLERLATHPDDRVDWGYTDKKGCNFINLAARDGVLFDVYPLVKDLPYFANLAKPVKLTQVALDVGKWRKDLRAAPAAIRADFAPTWF